MAGDAPVFEVAGTGKELLQEVLELGCRVTGRGPHGRHSKTPGQGSIVGYYSDEKRFVLFWYKSDKAIPLPAPMTAEQITPMVDAWLTSVANYGHQPDHDGDNGKGWRVFTGSWGHVSTNSYSDYVNVVNKDGDRETLKLWHKNEPEKYDFGHQSFLAIEPWWEMYGK